MSTGTRTSSSGSGVGPARKASEARRSGSERGGGKESREAQVGGTVGMDLRLEREGGREREREALAVDEEDGERVASY